MASDQELRFQRAQTLAFINANKSALTLTPRTRHRDGSGTRWVSGEPREPQAMRLIDQSSNVGPVPGVVAASDGVQRIVVYQLVGEHDAVMALWDYWADVAGVRLEVAELLPDNGYEKRGLVIRYGE